MNDLLENWIYEQMNVLLSFEATAKSEVLHVFNFPTSSLTRPKDISGLSLIISASFFLCYYKQIFHPKDKRDKWDQRKNVRKVYHFFYVVFI